MFSQCQIYFRGSFHLEWLKRYVFIQSTGVACLRGLKIFIVFGIFILRVGPAFLFSAWKKSKGVTIKYNGVLESWTWASSSCTGVQLLQRWDGIQKDKSCHYQWPSNAFQSNTVLLCVEYWDDAKSYKCILKYYLFSCTWWQPGSRVKNLRWILYVC